MSFFHNENKPMSSNQFANGSDQNCGNVITDRPTTRLHAPPGGKSSICFGGDDDSWSATATSSRPASKAKAREYAGHDIFGTNGPAPSHHAPEPAPHYAPVPAAAPAPSYAAPKMAEEAQIKAMMHPELRTLCREHGLSPAGAKGTLVERIMEAINAGTVQVFAKEEKTSGVSQLTNNYSRAEGQNVGNFITERTSSRVLRAPGGGSSISFGNSDDPGALSPSRETSNAKMVEMQGHDVFSDQREPDHNNDRYQVSEAKLRNDFQGHKIFDDGSNHVDYNIHHRDLSDAKLKSDLQGHNIFDDGEFSHRPTTASSSAKRAEMSGQDVFSDGQEQRQLYDQAISATRAMKIGADQRGHDIFSTDVKETGRRVTGGVHKPPGGGSSIVF